MTEAQTIRSRGALDSASEAAMRRVRRRYAANWRLQAYGIFAIALAIGLLGILLSSIIANGYTAFVQSKVDFEVYIDPSKVEASNPAKGNFRAIVRELLTTLYPKAESDKQKTQISKILTSDAAYIIRDYVVSHPDSIGKRITLPIALSDPYDQLNKGVIPRDVDALSQTQTRWFELLQSRGLVVNEAAGAELKVEVYVDPSKIEKGPPLSGDFAAMTTESLRSYLPAVSDQALFAMLAPNAPDVLKAQVEADPNLIGRTIQVLLPFEAPYRILAKGEKPMGLNPRFSPLQIAAFDTMVKHGMVHTPFNWELFFNADSRFPERAGLAGAITGTFLMLLVCFGLSFPIGISAAVYLEEFAPKNRLTDLIEVNINNLAAVPSVVFGLLGLAVFLGFFGLPSSTPLVGGMVLAFVTLPTIIIATRAALKAVPPSIEEAALGVGASKIKSSLHHVLPLAMPGIITGTIIGMVHALGETAPLLLIGMSAFILELSKTRLEPATTLPTQIYQLGGQSRARVCEREPQRRHRGVARLSRRDEPGRNCVCGKNSNGNGRRRLRRGSKGGDASSDPNTNDYYGRCEERSGGGTRDQDSRRATSMCSTARIRRCTTSRLKFATARSRP